MLNLERTLSPCPQCRARDIEVILVDCERSVCHCRTCGYSWTEPSVRPKPDRRRRDGEQS